MSGTLKTIATIMIFAIAPIHLTAQTAQSRTDSLTQPAANIYRQLATPDSATGARIIVHQSDEITKILQTGLSAPKREVKGFRIQIYSSNRGQSAKVKAFGIRDELLTTHPDLEVYVTYTSPFWKVRIGNCATHQDAQALRTWVIQQFPDYATETYIVPETVQIQ